jgi:hypothetical protein
MKKIILILLCLGMVLSSALYAAEAGTGLAFFVPESLYRHGEGSVSLETGLSTSLGLGSYLEIPFGFQYNKIQGFLVEGAKADGVDVKASAPWFMGDSFMPFVKVQANFPLGPLTFSGFAGGALNWNASLTPFEANAARDLAPVDGYAVITGFDYENKLGYGWLAGASLGITISPVTVTLFAEYRDIKTPLNLSGTFRAGPEDNITSAGTLEGGDATLLIRGITLGLGGSFAF